jgi:hypothetical protein
MLEQTLEKELSKAQTWLILKVQRHTSAEDNIVDGHAQAEWMCKGLRINSSSQVSQ